MLFLLVLFFLPNVVCHKDYQTIPLRYDAAINHLAQQHRSGYTDLLDDVSTYSLTSSKMSSYISSLQNNQTNRCEQEFMVALEAALKRDTWALKIFDAWGKPLPSGILKGNIYWIGNYDECLHPLYIPTNKTFVAQPFETQHCSLYPGLAAIEELYGANNLVFGLCVPSSCSSQEVVFLIHSLFKKSNVTEDQLVCSNDPANGQKGFTGGAIATIVILSLLGALVLVGTIVDFMLMPKVDSGDHISSNGNRYNHLVGGGINESESVKLPQRSFPTLVDTTPFTEFLAEFSALRTLRRIFTMKQKKDDDSFLFLNGVRVLSLFWVIIGHSFLFGVTFSSNSLDLITWTRNIFLQFISSAPFSVDTFFVMSGFLTAVVFIRHVKKEGKLSFRLMLLYYIHRYIRLTPAFLLVVLISINLTPYFGYGPVFPSQQGFEVNQCRTQYWWTSILYVSNIVQPDYTCLPVSWYLYNDMQFHWIAPLTLVPFVIGRKSLAFIMSTLLALVGVGSIAGILIYYPALQSQGNGLIDTQLGPTFFNQVYVTPWCRVSPYFIGVLAGFLVINTGRSCRINKYALLLGNIIAIIFALYCLFAMYPDSILVPGIDRASYIIYQSLSRTLWSISMGWVFFLCAVNRGGIANKFLSWPIWAPIARLNYATYLTHLTVIFIMITNQRVPLYYQPHLVVNNFISQMFFSYVTAIVVVIFLETPFFIIEKKLFKR